MYMLQLFRSTEKISMRRLLSSYPVVIQSVITSVFSVSFLSVPVVYAEAEDVVYVTAADDEHYEPRGYGALRQSAATKGSASLAETPQFVSVIRRDQLDTLPAESLSKALRYSAGVASEKFGGSRAKRGSGNNNIKSIRYNNYDSTD